MTQLKLKKLEVEGFRSFKEPATVEFPSDGTILIQGKYHGSQVGSGAGKSSLVIAIAYALGFSAPPSTDLKNWSSKKMRVALLVTDGTTEYLIVRDPKLSITVDGNTQSGKVADELLAKILKIDVSLAETLAYRQQRKPGMFLNSTDSAKKEFLSSVLGLSDLEKGQELLQAQLGKYDQSSQLLRARVDALAPSAMSMDKANVDFEAATMAHADAISAYGKVSASAQQGTELTARLNATRADLRKYQDIRNKLVSIESENRNLKANIASTMSELEHLKAATCPTCRREWDAAGNSILKSETHLSEMKNKFLANMEFTRNSEAMITAIPELEKQANDLQSEIGSLNAPVMFAQQSLNNAKSQLSLATNAKNNAQSARDQIQTALAEIANNEKQSKSVRHAHEILGRNGFLSVIFDEVLAEVESRSNDMISKIPNISRFTLKLSSTATLKSGASKKTIASTLFADGEEISVAAVSGGQKCALELCTDLAISETIRSRSGSPIGWTVLDEAMDGLDTATKQEALQMILDTIKGQVVVIDHATEVQEGASHVVNVEFDGKNSRIL